MVGLHAETLQTVDFSHNPLTALPIEVGNLQLLKELQKWEVGVGLLGNLVHMGIENTQLVAWPAQFETLIFLQSLRIGKNMLQELPVSICDHPKLTALDISSNMVAKLPLSVFYLPIKTLNLQHNQIPALPDKNDEATKPPPKLMRQFKSTMTDMDLSHNKVEELGNLMPMLIALKTLDVSFNMLRHISNEDFCQVTTLSSLNLSHNDLMELPADFGNCRLLTNLDVSHNKLIDLPVSMSLMRSLTLLDASNNKLLEFSGKISAMLSNLEVLHLQHNALSKLPVSLFSCNKIHSLDFSFNEITHLQASVGKLTALTFLNASHNAIQLMPEEISGAINLVELNFSYNQLAFIPESIVGLTKLTRLYLDHNSLTENPLFLRSLPLLRGWNLSWNRIPGNYTDPRSIDKGYNALTDPLPLQSLQQLIHQGWDRLNLLLTEPNSYRPLIITQVGHAEASMLGKELAHAQHKRETMHQKIRMTIVEVNKWEKQLGHFLSGLKFRPNLSINMNSATANSGNNSVINNKQIDPRDVSDEEIDRISTVGLIALERRRCQLQYALLYRKIMQSSMMMPEMLELVLYEAEPSVPTSGTASKVSMKPAASVAGSTTQRTTPRLSSASTVGVDGVPDASVIETLNLGLEYQRPIDIFEQSIRELSVLAILDWAQVQLRTAKYKQTQKQLKQDQEQQEQNQLANKEMLEAAFGEKIPQGTSGKSGKQPAYNPAKKQAHSNIDELLANVSSLRGLAVDKKLIVNTYTLPRILHYPMLGMETSPLSICSLHAYIGLGMTLMMRADKIAQAIRVVERRGEVKVSALNVAQRFGEDYLDLLEDVSGGLTNRIKAQTKIAATGINATKETKKTARARLAQQANVNLEIADDGSVSSTGNSSIHSHATHNTHNTHNTHGMDGHGGGKKAKERKAPIDDDEIINAPIPTHTARNCVNYLLKLRMHILIWASKVLDSAAETLSMCGWDNAFMASYINNSKIGEAVGLEARGLRSYAVDVFYLRGRAFQGLDMLSQALSDLKTAKKLAPRHRQVTIELVKNCLASGDYVMAKNYLMGVIRTDCESLHADKQDDVLFVFRHNKELGLLLMYCHVYIDNMHACGVNSQAQQKAYSILDNGLLQRPAEILCPELKYGRRKNYDRQCERFVEGHTEFARHMEIEESRDALEKGIGKMFTKYQQIISDTRLELDEVGFLTK
jgi:Leucine-rich repeat (LRR) protein